MAFDSMKLRRVSTGFFAVLFFAVLITVISLIGRGRALAQGQNPPVNGPWMDKTLSPDRRADLVVQERGWTGRS